MYNNETITMSRGLMYIFRAKPVPISLSGASIQYDRVVTVVVVVTETKDKYRSIEGKRVNGRNDKRALKKKRINAAGTIVTDWLI
jgi:hypothetical protein